MGGILGILGLVLGSIFNSHTLDLYPETTNRAPYDPSPTSTSTTQPDILIETTQPDIPSLDSTSSAYSEILHTIPVTTITWYDCDPRATTLSITPRSVHVGPILPMIPRAELSILPTWNLQSRALSGRPIIVHPTLVPATITYGLNGYDEITGTISVLGRADEPLLAAKPTPNSMVYNAEYQKWITSLQSQPGAVETAAPSMATVARRASNEHLYRPQDIFETPKKLWAPLSVPTSQIPEKLWAPLSVPTGQLANIVPRVPQDILETPLSILADRPAKIVPYVHSHPIAGPILEPYYVEHAENPTAEHIAKRDAPNIDVREAYATHYVTLGCSHLPSLIDGKFSETESNDTPSSSGVWEGINPVLSSLRNTAPPTIGSDIEFDVTSTPILTEHGRGPQYGDQSVRAYLHAPAPNNTSNSISNSIDDSNSTDDSNSADGSNSTLTATPVPVDQSHDPPYGNQSVWAYLYAPAPNSTTKSTVEVAGTLTATQVEHDDGHLSEESTWAILHAAPGPVVIINETDAASENFTETTIGTAIESATVTVTATVTETWTQIATETKVEVSKADAEEESTGRVIAVAFKA